MVNLLFCGNSKMYDGILISLLSILKHTLEDLNIYILTADFSEKNKEYIPFTYAQLQKIDKIIKEKNSNNSIKLIDITDKFKNEMSQTINMNTSYTPYIFLRLFVDEIEELPNKLLYLDTDIICYKDIKELFDIDVSNYEFGACKDYLGRWFIDYNYLNSGVLLLNLDKIRKNNSFSDCRKMCNEKKMLLPDQTALNKMCKYKLILPRKYNEQKCRNDETVIRHFSMTIKLFPYKKVNIKPWNIEKIHNVYGIHDFDDVWEEFTLKK